MQQCCGVVPLAQVRETFTAVRFLGEHLPLERLYGLTPTVDDLEDQFGAGGGANAARFVWSPFGICEALAVKRGFLIAKTGRPDAHAAGRQILFDSQDGLLPLFWLPPPAPEGL